MRILLCSLFLTLYVAFYSRLQAQVVEVLVCGIAQDAGHPQIGCDKPCCSKAFSNPDKMHKTACLAVANGENFFLFDATPDIRSQLHDAENEFEGFSIGGVFLTHAHIGHYTGLMHFGREAMATIDLPVYAMPRMRQFLSSNGPWDQLVSIHNIDIIALEEDSTIVIGSLKVTPFIVPHRDEYSETVGYRIEGPNASLAYIPDIDKWERWEGSLSKLVQNTDVILLDGTFFDEKELPGRNMAEIPHPFIVETMEELKVLSSEERSKVYFTHFNHTNPILQDGSEASTQVEKAGFRVADEGMRFQL